MRHALIPSFLLASLIGISACGTGTSNDPSAPTQTPSADPSTPTKPSEPTTPSEPGTPTTGTPTPEPEKPGTPVELPTTEAVVTPDDPGAADVRFDIDSTEGTQAISPYIYGANERDWSSAPYGLTLGRAGGNRWTAYNWENNASNAGSDWMHQNDGYLGGGDSAGNAVLERVKAAHDAGASMLVTIPILDYVAADKNGNGDVAQSGNYLNSRFRKNVLRKDGAFEFPPSQSDDAVYQDEFVAWLESEFPNARTDSSRTIFYSMDNEPDLWSHTHERIHPGAVGYQELADRVLSTAEMVKDVAGQDAVVFGPVNYGWLGLVNLQNAPDANGRDFVEFFLGEMKKADDQNGHRVVDVFDLHWYPEARGGSRITSDASDASTAEARMQAPRSLWDADYKEDSWIAGTVQGGINLIPRMQEKIDRIYPGTDIAFTEYYYGGGDHISGGIAQADVLGIYGREGVFAANLWHLGNTDDRFIHGAFEMFRNFDGNNGTFGDVSVPASTSDHVGTSVYASVHQDDPSKLVVVAINKTGQAQDAGIAVTHRGQFSKAEVYQMTDGNPGPVRADDVTLTGTNAFTYTMPAYSVSTLVLVK